MGLNMLTKISSNINTVPFQANVRMDDNEIHRPKQTRTELQKDEFSKEVKTGLKQDSEFEKSIKSMQEEIKDLTDENKNPSYISKPAKALLVLGSAVLMFGTTKWSLNKCLSMFKKALSSKEVKAMQEMAQNTLTKSKEVATDVATRAKRVTNDINESNVWKNIKKPFVKTGEFVKKIFNEVKDFVVAKFQKAKTWFEGTKFFKKVYHEIALKKIYYGDIIKESKLYNFFKKTSNKVAKDMPEVAKKTGEAVSDFAKTTVKKAKNIDKTKVENIAVNTIATLSAVAGAGTAAGKTDKDPASVILGDF